MHAKTKDPIDASVAQVCRWLMLVLSHYARTLKGKCLACRRVLKGKLHSGNSIGSPSQREENEHGVARRTCKGKCSMCGRSTYAAEGLGRLAEMILPTQTTPPRFEPESCVATCERMRNTVVD